MAKAVSLDSKDLAPAATKPRSATRQRGVVPSSEFVPMQFRFPPAFVKEFKVAAAQNEMRLNELFMACFQHFMKTNNSASLADQE